MNRIFLKLTLFSGSLCLVLAGLFFVSGYASKNHRLGLSVVKQHRLQIIDRPKVVLVGGSSLHYGMDSSFLECSLNVPVVNMGIQASIGLRYMFEEVLGEIGINDVVILLAEPAHYYKVDIDGEKTLYGLISKYPAGLKHLNLNQYWNSLYSIGPVIDDNFRYFLQFVAMRFLDRPTVLEATNSRGDYVGHQGKESIFRPFPADDVSDGYVISDKTLRFLRQTRIEIEAKGAHLFIGFAPTAASAVDAKTFDAVENHISPEIKLGTIREYTLPDEYFYDTSHHLLYEKRKLRTEMLLQDIENNSLISRLFDVERGCV